MSGQRTVLINGGASLLAGFVRLVHGPQRYQIVVLINLPMLEIGLRLVMYLMRTVTLLKVISGIRLRMIRAVCLHSCHQFCRRVSCG